MLTDEGRRDKYYFNLKIIFKTDMRMHKFGDDEETHFNNWIVSVFSSMIWVADYIKLLVLAAPSTKVMI